MTSPASILGALTASYLFLSTATGTDLTTVEKKPGEDQVPNESDTSADTGLDPTILNSRVALTNEFKDQEGSAAKDTATLNLAYAFGQQSRPEWTVQVDLPLVHYDAGRLKGVSSGTGFGDVEARIGHVLRSEGMFRYAAGFEVEFDTAGGPPLGDGIFRISPIVGFAVEPCSTFKFQTFLQFNQSLLTESGVSEEQELHVKPAITFNLPDNWYVYMECEETWEFPAHGDFSSTIKFEFGRGFGRRGEWALSARCELPLTKSSDDYTVTTGLTYVFK